MFSCCTCRSGVHFPVWSNAIYQPHIISCHSSTSRVSLRYVHIPVFSPTHSDHSPLFSCFPFPRTMETHKNGANLGSQPSSWPSVVSPQDTSMTLVCVRIPRMEIPLGPFGLTFSAVFVPSQLLTDQRYIPSSLS